MNRRGFLKSMLVAGTAPFALGAGGILLPAAAIESVRAELILPERELDLIEKPEILIPSDLLVLPARNAKVLLANLAMGVPWKVRGNRLISGRHEFQFWTIESQYAEFIGKDY